MAVPRRLRSRLALAATVFALTVVSLVGGTPSQAGTVVEPWIDTSNREAVAIAYAEEFARTVPDMDWTGAYDGCDPGGSSEDLALATVRRVNFYRAMAGVPTGVTLNREYSARAQAGALSMSATGRLSHTPDDSFLCLSDDAIAAAANSNLYLGRTGPAAIDGYIEDPGDRNRDVGHRNTILHPPTTEIGVGHVAGTDQAYPANALWVFDEGVFDDNPPVREDAGFVAWPPRGYVPAELIHPRWSFGLAGADFEDAEVTMTSGGRTVELEVVARLSQQGYVPAPIIVWEPVEGSLPGRTDADSDLDYRIQVAGVVVDGVETTFAYTVTAMADRPGRRNGLPIDPIRLAFRATEATVGDLGR
ncbi:MAG: CAP domain-containing protein [Actinomycetota bacterium]